MPVISRPVRLVVIDQGLGLAMETLLWSDNKEKRWEISYK